MEINNINIKTLNTSFNKKSFKTYIKIHKILLSITIIINIVLVIFIIVFKLKISEIKSKSFINSINPKSINYISTINKPILNKLVNIFAISMSSCGNFHFSLIFENSNEVNMVKEIIGDFKIEKNPNLLLVYQGITETDISSIIFKTIKYYSNTLTLIVTKNGDKFAFFFDGRIIPDKNESFESDNYYCFILSFKDKAKYYSKIVNKTFEVNKEYLFNIGNGDIIINHNYHTYGGNINFPFKNFYIPENKGDLFRKINGHIEVKDIEIYAVIYEDYDYYDLRKVIFL